jgi:hypothetical protein
MAGLAKSNDAFVKNFMGAARNGAPVKSHIVSPSGIVKDTPSPGYFNPEVVGLGKQPHTPSVKDMLNPKTKKPTYFDFNPPTESKLDFIRDGLSRVGKDNASAKTVEDLARLWDTRTGSNLASVDQDKFYKVYQNMARVLGENESVVNRLSDVQKARIDGIPHNYWRSAEYDNLWQNRSPKLRSFFDIRGPENTKLTQRLLKEYPPKGTAKPEPVNPNMPMTVRPKPTAASSGAGGPPSAKATTASADLTPEQIKQQLSRIAAGDDTGTLGPLLMEDFNKGLYRTQADIDGLINRMSYGMGSYLK